MGKIRVKTLGEEPEVKKTKSDSAKAKYEEHLAKKAAVKAQEDKIEQAKKTTEEIDNAVKEVETSTAVVEEAPKEEKTAAQPKKATKKSASKRYKESQTLVNKSTVYPLDKALEMLKKFKKAKFDETVELHLNTKEKGINGQVVLPHGTGKKLNVKVADDKLIAQIEAGKIDFDVLIAEPSMMPKLAKVARVLGPRGLMPNPKNGTITDKPEQAIEKLTKGQISYKTEGKAPIMHVSVGKVSFEDKALKENITTLIASVGTGKIEAITLKSTMSPAIKIDTAKLA